MSAKTKLMPHQRHIVKASTLHDVGIFNYPTGTGKTIGEAHIIANDIKRQKKPKIYAVLAPRIMLAQQIFKEVWQEVVMGTGQDCHFFSLHSGKTVTFKDAATKKKSVLDDRNDEEDLVQVRKELEELGIPTRTFESGTSVNAVKHAIARAKADGVPLIICSTYHSAHRLDKIDEPIEILIADEAHNVTAEEFSHTVHNLSDRRYYFTATLKHTDGSCLGMNNADLFGEVIGSMSPREAVEKGLILRPRMHWVEIDAEINEGNEYKADIEAITISFNKHRQMTGGIQPKLLVACRGTKDIRQILENSGCFERLRKTNPGLMIFSIISGQGCAIINGVSLAREDFMNQLKSLPDTTPAIILHYDILSEGIDIPGITGVMPLRNLGVSKFLQTLGRASRLHVHDRANRPNPMASDWESHYVKPYAWVIIPCYSNTGAEINGSVQEYIEQLRQYDWMPVESVISTSARGDAEPEEMSTMYEDDDEHLSNTALLIVDTCQSIEEKVYADAFRAEIKKATPAELLQLLVMNQ